VAGPQTYSLDGGPSFSGVPRSAKAVAEGELEALLWPGIEWQMASGDRRGFVRPVARYRVPAVTVHRFALRDGGTIPVIGYEDSLLQLDQCGLRFSEMSGGNPILADSQSRAIVRLLRGDGRSGCGG
jgi:hypothetical protein